MLSKILSFLGNPRVKLFLVSIYFGLLTALITITMIARKGNWDVDADSILYIQSWTLLFTGIMINMIVKQKPQGIVLDVFGTWAHLLFFFGLAYRYVVSDRIGDEEGEQHVRSFSKLFSSDTDPRFILWGSAIAYGIVFICLMSLGLYINAFRFFTAKTRRISAA